jgi:SAM-dependent methyltransferase
MLNDLFTHLEEKSADLILITCSSPVAEKKDVQKVTIKPVLIKHKLHFQLVLFEKTKCITKNIPQTDLKSKFDECLKCYENIFVRFKDVEYHVTNSVGGKVSVRKKLLKIEHEQDLSHNRKKKYLLEENQPLEWLCELGIQKNDGKILQGARDKFTQVNRFLEIVKDILPELPKKLRIIDVGCGKGYLTFALYHYLHTMLELDCEIIGIDLKEDVVAKCNELAKKVGFSRLHFKNINISDFAPQEPVDLVISLHACNTATCTALAKAVLWQAKAILVAPCCQHELASQIDTHAFEVVLKHGLFRERFSALLTDALRVELLEALGYKVQVLEFVDPEHTPKNLLIRAVKKQNHVDYTKFEEYNKIAKQFGISLTFERLLQSQQDKKTR